MQARQMRRELRESLIVAAGGKPEDVDAAIVVGPDEDGYYYLCPPDPQQDCYAWSVTPEVEPSWRASAAFADPQK